ncbi:MAG TPA: phosphohistidine phosphatase SixA [Nitrospirota bacterium]|nr:phosphohistidine phosphatase SixA [Nitrospirota bacterium]
MTNVGGKEENICFSISFSMVGKERKEDPARGVTATGVQDVRKVAAYSQKMILRISRIFHSGKTRAMQTAQIFADYHKPEKGGFETGRLAPMYDPTIWAKHISEMQENTTLAGHLPHRVKLAALLLCGNKEKMFIDFKMGGVVCLMRYDDDRWAMELMIVPEIVV